VVQHCPVNVSNVSSPTANNPPAMLNCGNKFNSSNELFIGPAELIAVNPWAKLCMNSLKEVMPDLSDLPELHTFDHL
jgi:hypothetical protein